MSLPRTMRDRLRKGIERLQKTTSTLYLANDTASCNQGDDSAFAYVDALMSYRSKQSEEATRYSNGLSTFDVLMESPSGTPTLTRHSQKEADVFGLETSPSTVYSDASSSASLSAASWPSTPIFDRHYEGVEAVHAPTWRSRGDSMDGESVVATTTSGSLSRATSPKRVLKRHGPMPLYRPQFLVAATPTTRVAEGSIPVRMSEDLFWSGEAVLTLPSLDLDDDAWARIDGSCADVFTTLDSLECIRNESWVQGGSERVVSIL